MPTSTSDIQAQALAERGEEVTKELVKKYKVIAQRRGALKAHVDSFEAKVKAFDDAVTASDNNPEAIMAALEAHKFPYNCVNLQGSK